jgi:hypothetical protein
MVDQYRSLCLLISLYLTRDNKNPGFLDFSGLVAGAEVRFGNALRCQCLVTQTAKYWQQRHRVPLGYFVIQISP